ncbi:hypothetical protein HBA55_29465 [Pseudomaricurvus alkylphenolicus]|uniref:hypothetical protein n=1 Tax=Pseudomaricurvus alkylphenolicus TaxID=1306991 RepID=UPI00142394D2|nr:hypothetical protein [Pseudomaricurvus alkylphenolicus]NIB43767.1 hypothetical protein [Pseudomaricurvus alkylphenolicus]
MKNRQDEIRTMSLDSILATKHHELRFAAEAAVEALKDEPGKLISREADYEVAWYEENGFRVVVYPHRTSAGNYHLRIRMQGKRKGSDRARYIMTKLYRCTPHDINFQWKGMGINQILKWEREFGFA